jgi:hypothetical protein
MFLLSLSALKVFPTVATSLEGVDAAFDWLTAQIAFKMGTGLAPYLKSAYNVVHYPADFIKNSWHSLSGIFSPSKPQQADGKKLVAK